MTDSPPQPRASLGRGQSVLLLYGGPLCPWLCQYRVNISYVEDEESYITHSVSSHGCFSVNSARTNFTVLKQLMVPKECVMSCQEIWSFPVCKEKTCISLGLIRIISQLNQQHGPLEEHSWCGRDGFWRFSRDWSSRTSPSTQLITIFGFLSFFLIYCGAWHTKLTTLANLNCTAQGPLACSQIVQPSPPSSSRFHHPRRSRLPELSSQPQFPALGSYQSAFSIYAFTY